MEQIGTVERAIIAIKQALAIASLAEGMTVTAAAQAAGVGRTTLHRWLREPLFCAKLDEAKLEAAERAVDRIRLMNERHTDIAVLAQEKVIQRLKYLDPSELSPMALIRYFYVAVKVERLARGLDAKQARTTHIPVVSYNGDVGSPISVQTYDAYAEFEPIGEGEDYIPGGPEPEDEDEEANNEYNDYWLSDDDEN